MGQGVINVVDYIRILKEVWGMIHIE